MENKEKEEKKKAKPKKERKLERELLYILGFAVFLVFVFWFADSVFKSMNKFEYGGLEFKKVRVGNIPFYYYSYYFTTGEGKKLFQYNLFLRIDPRENNVSVEGGKINFDKSTVYLSVNSSALRGCPDSVIAIADLARFLADNQLKVKSGNPDSFDAEKDGNEWVTCENKPDKKVITVNADNETKIKINENCYEITVNNCEILAASEKFRLQSIIDAK